MLQNRIRGGWPMMNIEILEKLHFILTLIFGIVLSVSFLGIHKYKAASNRFPDPKAAVDCC